MPTSISCAGIVLQSADVWVFKDHSQPSKQVSSFLSHGFKINRLPLFRRNRKMNKLKSNGSVLGISGFRRTVPSSQQLQLLNTTTVVNFYCQLLLADKQTALQFTNAENEFISDHHSNLYNSFFNEAHFQVSICSPVHILVTYP